MLRMKPVSSATRAEAYYAKSDGGYYLNADDLHREWGGRAAKMLGLSGTPEFEQFRKLIHGLDPRTGDQLTARLDDDRIPAWDVTASVPKGVTTVIERGDDRVRAILWEANRQAMGDLEAYATTRVRKGGEQSDRVTGNGVWYSVEHPETRPTAEDNMPDWDRHIHNVYLNVTYDRVEREWKAVKFRPIMDLRKYFDRCFDHRLSGMLADAGYEIETKWKPDGKGGMKFYSWDIKGIPDSVIQKNSRRSAEVDATERDILETLREQNNGQGPDQLSAVSRDTLGATSRRQKREDLTLADYREYWNSRITPDESRAIGETIKRALLGQNERPERSVVRAVAFSREHHFEQRSVVPFHEIAITAMEQSMGRAKPEDIEPEAFRQGLLLRQFDGKWLATTADLMREEDRMVGFAAGGRGTMLPVGVPEGLERGTLNDGQWDTVCGLLNSSNRVNVVEGPAGAGKSFMLAAYDRGMRMAGQTVTYLATTSDATSLLVNEGFDANTVARFLLDEKLQEAARGGYVVCDETSMMGHRDAVKLFGLAEKMDLKLNFLGDPLQHGSVPRGALLHLLKTYAGIQPFRLREIMRQETPDYLAAVRLLSEGLTVDGFDALDRMGWVKEIGNEDRYTHLAADYVRALEDNKSVLIVSPTHAEAATITKELRRQLQAAGKLGTEEREFTRLVAANASEAERGQAMTYRPGDVLVFHQNAKGFKKGDRITVTDPASVPLAEAAKFSLYQPETIALSEGDRLRITGTVKTMDDKHTLKNGAVKTVAGFDAQGNIRLDNGWIVDKDAGHFRMGWVDTSFAAQGKTVQRVLLGMASASANAMNQEQMYVSASRAREQLRLYTDSKEAVRDAVQRSSQKLAALDLRSTPKPTLMERLRNLLERRRRHGVVHRMRSAWDRTARPTPPRTPTPYREKVTARQEERESGRGR